MNKVATISNSPINAMAERLSIDPQEMQNIIMATVMPSGGKGVTAEQFASFVAVSNSYGLDPLKKEIYAFPAKGGGIQPIVSIDGWLSIVHSHPDYDGMELHENFDEKGKIFSVKCSIHKKSISHPVVITEYLSECKRNTEPWKKEVRMLRHKAVIQCARYAFGLSGIMEQDEAEAAIEKDITPTEKPKSALRRPDPKEEKVVAESKPKSEKTNDPSIFPVKDLLGMISRCERIDQLELVREDAEKYPADSEEFSILATAYNERLAALQEVKS